MRPGHPVKPEGRAVRSSACRGIRKVHRFFVNHAIDFIAVVAIAVAPALAQAQQLPTGGSVAAGSATISAPASGTLNVNQSSDRAVINWNSFSVGQGGTVNFNQPSAASATLNRVTGSTPSSIAGTINAPGTVLLVNPNGIAITKSGVINTGSFAASTLDIKDNDFMSGNYKFTGNGSSGVVTNAGRINVSDGGFAALLGGQVANDGVISARLGRVGLGSGELITLDLSGDGFLSVAVPTSSLGGIVGADGNSLVSNKGRIVADGGMVYLSAATAAGLLRDAVNVPGSIRANSVGTSNGKIVIGGGAGGKVRIAGKLKANGGKTAKGGSIAVSGAQVAVSGKVSAKGTTGGTVKLTASDKADVSGTIAATGTTGSGGVVILTADQVTLGSTAKLDASGATGGTLLIGGDYQGGANTANNFSIEVIKNALTTSVAAGATLSAAGTNGEGGKIVVWSDDVTQFAGHVDVSSAGGTGGFAEVSGHRLLDFTGTANLGGTAGVGTLLLDPRNVTISLSADSGGSLSGGTYTPSADDSILLVTTLQSALASGNVIVTTGSTGSQSGDITVANNISWSSANSLTLSAYRNVVVNALITNTGGAAVNLRADSTGTGTGTVTFASSIVDVSTSGILSIYYNPTGDSTSVNSSKYTSGTQTSYASNILGGGTLKTIMLVNTVFDLQNIQNYLAGSYALGRDIDASATATWNSNAGFVPIGSNANQFTGIFDGQNHVIDGLTINRATTDYVGLFGDVGGSQSLSNVGLTNANIVGRDFTGALAGQSYATITNAYSTGAVSGRTYTGGLVGYAISNVTQSHSDASVTSTGSWAGGLLGSLASVGQTVSNSYATGNVNGVAGVGGLVGNLAGTIQTSYASGSVTGTDSGVGGLVAFADTSSAISNSYATGAVSATNGYVGGLAGTLEGGSISKSYSSGLVTGSLYAGGFIGVRTGGTVTGSFWDTTTSGKASGVGGGSTTGMTGKTSTQLLTKSTYTGASWDFTNTWYMVDGSTRPFLQMEASTTITNAHQLQLVGMNATTLAASYTLANDINLGAALSNASGMWGSKGWVPIGTSSAMFSGSFNGQSHVISGLTINRSADYNGLFGFAGNGASISSVSLTGLSIAGGNLTGSLIGEAATTTTVSNVNVSGTVSGLYQVGGLIGKTASGTTISDSWTAVTVTGANDGVGGLVGEANGDVTRSYATGTVTGDYQVGGLFGHATNLTILQSFSTGAVSAASFFVGGLVGQTDGNVTINQSFSRSSVTGASKTGGLVGGVGIGNLTLQESYAAGYVAVTSNNGGLVGALVGGTAAITNAYWDTLTTGMASSAGGGTGYTTSQLQAALPSGFNSSVWGIVAGKSYAYLSGFYSGTPQVISGNAYDSSGSTALAGEKVSALINGSNAGSIYSGANGYYNILLPSGSIGANSQVVAYTTGVNAGVAYQQNASGSQSGLIILAGWLNETSAAASMSSISSGLATAIGSSGVSTALANRHIVATSSSFTLDEALTHSGTLRISAAGTVTQNAGASITANALRLSLTSGGATFTLLDAGNSFATLGTSNLGTGSLNVYDSAALSIGGAITANGGLVIRTAGQLTLANTVSSTATGDAVVLVAGTTFRNNFGSTPISVPNGRWLIYAGTPTGSIFNSLNSNNDAVWNATYANNAPSTIASGNRYVFALQPTVTFTSTSASKYYGASANVSSNYAVSSNVSAVANAFTVASLGSLYTGTPTVSSAGTETTATVAGGPYVIDIAQGSVVSTGAYALNFASSGLLTVNKASLIIYAGSANKTYGTTYSSTTNFTASGLFNGDTVTSADLASAGAAATADVGNYALTASNAVGTGLSNYNVLYSAGNLQVGQAVLTINASNASKVYGSTKTFAGTEFTASGLVNGDTVSGVSLTSTGAAATANVGGYQIAVSSATGAKISNYLIFYNNGSLSVTQAPLTVTATNQSKTYGTAYDLGSTAFTTSALYNGDTITGATLTSGATAATAAAGAQTIYVSGATGPGASNYNITYVNAVLTVNQAPLTITANDATKTYGVNVGLGYTSTGTLYNSDTLTGVTLTSAGASAGAAVTGSPYAITASAAQGNGLYNYAITYVDGALTVNPAALTVTANSASKTYNGVAFSGGNGVTYSGFVNGQDATALGGTLSYGGTAQGAVNAGTYSITASGQTSSNYTISYQPGTLTVNQAPLTVTANSQNKTYGTEITFAGTEFTKTGTLYGSDSIDSVTLTGAGAAATANAAGVPYTITASNAQGTGASNYAITYVDGSMMVFPKALTVTADNTSKVYGTALGSTATSGFTTSGLVNSDSVDSVNFSGSGLAGTASVGVYQLDVGGALGTGLSNYSIIYNPGQMTVTAAPLTVTANNQTKTYGTAYDLGSTDISVTGTLYNSDAITGATLTSGATAATAAAGFQTLYVSGATGPGVSNYNITYVNGRLTVNQAPLTITANDQTKTYGTNPGFGTTAYTSSGTLYNSDTLTGVTLTSAGASANAAVTGSPYAITASAPQGNGLYNYAITYVDGALTVNPAALTVTANNASKTYNGVAYSGGNGVTYSGLVNGETSSVLGGTLSYGGTAQNSKDAGTYSITASGLTSSNYTISYQPGTLTVNQAPLTVTANSQNKTYGAEITFAGTEFTTTGTLYGGDSINSVTLASAGAGATANAAGVPYTITASNAQGTGVGNYAITYANGSMMVNPKALTITADSGSKTYGTLVGPSGTSGFTVSGLVNSDSVTGANLSSAGFAGTADANVYQINVSAASGTGLSNYSITYNPGLLTVTPASLTVTASNQSKIYGTAYDLGSTAFTTSGILYNGDSISAVTLASGAAAATAAAGAQTIYVSGATGTGASNYSITYVNAVLTVNQAPLTITVNNQSKTYGDNLNLGTTAYSVTSGTLFNSDTLTGVTLSSPGAFATAPVAGSPYAITASAPQGNGIYNYAITYVNGALTVNPATLTVTANNASKTYDAAAYSGGNGVTYSGFVNGQDATALGGTLSYSGTAQGAVNAGTYSITASGQTSSNYTISYQSGALTVDKAALTYTADAASMTYGGTVPALSGQVTGFKGGDTLVNATSGTLAWDTTATSASNAGSYAITGSGLTAANYTLSQAAGNATAFTVTPSATLIYVADTASRTYGDANPSLTGTVIGFVNGDTLATATTGTAVWSTTATASSNAGSYGIVGSGLVSSNYAFVQASGNSTALTVNQRAITVTANAQSKTYDNNAATDPALTYTVGGLGLVSGDSLTGALNRVAGQNAGSYAIGQGTVANSNYAITYTSANFVIDQRAITVAANAQSKTYDNNAATDPALTYTVGGLGLVSGDSLSGSLTRAAGENAGSYVIGQGTVANSNYAITYTSANFVIDPRAITVAANAQSKTYDNNAATDPALTYTVGGLGLVSGDSLSGALNRVAGQNAGSYAIGQGTVANSNYAITYTGANFVIDPRAITVAANAQSKTYDNNAATDPALTYTVGGLGLVSGDSLTGSLTRVAGQNAGSYAIGQGTVANSNYAITYTGANFVIDPRAITVAANAQSKTYDNNAATDPALTYTVGGLGLVSGDSLSGSLTRAAGQNAGSYAIGQGTVANSNYAITYTGANFVIDPRAVTVTANAQSKTYDNNAATDPALTYTVGGLGLVSGDSLTGSLTRAAGQDAGSYAIGQGTVANSNYAITYTGANFVIDQRAITVAADAQAKTYGDADPTLSYSISGGSLVAGDIFAGTLARAAGENVGNYAINQGTLANANYAISFTGADLSIGQRAIAVTADAQSKQAGQADPALTYRVTTGNLVGADTLTGVLSRVAGESVGAYAIQQGTLAASSNYIMAFIGAHLQIVDAPAVATNTNGYEPAIYQPRMPGGTQPVVNVSYQSGGNTSAPTITFVTTPAVSSSTVVNQNIAPAGGQSDLFWPISQFDKAQYTGGTLPDFAAQTGESTVLAMIARAAENNRQAPLIDQLWTNGAKWSDPANRAAGRVTFTDGNGQTRTPGVDSGFPFVNGAVDVASLLQNGPLMLGAKPADPAQPASWLLAIKLTDDGKGIVANDPVTGSQVVLAYDPATKMVGGATKLVDQTSRAIVPLDAAKPATGIDVPASAWDALKAFSPESFFAVTM